MMVLEFQIGTTDEERYCTGSEDESRCADSSSASHESVTSLSSDASVRGEEARIMEVPRAEANTRPVRSTYSFNSAIEVL